MEITKRNVQRNYKRNKDIVALGSGGSVKGGIDLPPLNFLPATANDDGSYTVDVNNVKFSGSILAQYEVTARGVNPSEEGGTGGTTDYNQLVNKPALNGEELTSQTKIKTINKQSLLGEGDLSLEGIGTKVVDNLTTKNKDYALSANQGTILKSITDNKAEKFHTHNILDITDLNLKIYDQHISNKDIHVDFNQKTSWNNKLDKSIWDKAFYFDDQNNLRVRQNLIGNGEITAYGVNISEGGIAGLATTDYNELFNKPAVNGIELTSTTKFKTINGQQIIGEGDIKIEGGSSQIGVTSYNDLIDKPQLNGMILSSTSKLKTINSQSLLGEGDIKIEGGSGGTDDYTYLVNKPKINGEILIGDMSIPLGTDDYNKLKNRPSLVGEMQANKGEIFNCYINEDDNPPTPDNVNDFYFYHFVNDASGEYAHAEGASNKARGDMSHAEGFHNQIMSTAAHAEGRKNYIVGSYSHVEGSTCRVYGQSAHAEGCATRAGWYDDQRNVLGGDMSHAEGFASVAEGESSHAEGDHTMTFNLGEHAEGFYNISHKTGYKYPDHYYPNDFTKQGTVSSIGFGWCGDVSHETLRRNAFEVWTNGNVYIYGINKFNGQNPDKTNSLQSYISDLEYKLAVMQKQIDDLTNKVKTL